MLGPYAQNKLTDAILHCLWGAGLLAGLQNPADPPQELWVTSILQKAEQTRGILFHVNKILKYKLEIPSIAGQSEGKILLGAYSLVLLLQKRMAPSPLCSILLGQLRSHKGKGACPLMLSLSLLLEVKKWDCHAWQWLELECWDPKVLGRAGPQQLVSTKVHVHGGHAWQGPLCSGDTGQHTACPNPAGTSSWLKGRM